MINEKDIVEEFAEKVEQIVRKSNAETKGIETAASRRAIVNQIMLGLEKVVKNED